MTRPVRSARSGAEAHVASTRLWRFLPTAVLLTAMGCGGSALNCGACGEAYAPYPLTTASVPNGTAFVEDGVRVRLTQVGLDFLQDNLQNIIAAQFPQVRPGVIGIAVPTTAVLGGNPEITLGEGPEEIYPTTILIDINDLRSHLDFNFVDEGIEVIMRDLPFGIDARVFGQMDILGLANANAACQISGTSCPADDPGCGIVTTVTITAVITPRVGRGAECDTGVGECVLLGIDVGEVDLGELGASSLAVSQPPHDSDDCDNQPDVRLCSPTCSDTVILVDDNGNTECAALCGISNFFSNIILSVVGFLENALGSFLDEALNAALRNALQNVDGAPLSASSRLAIGALAGGGAGGVLPEGALDLGFALAPTGNAFDVNQPSGGSMGMDFILKSGFEAAAPLDTSAGLDVPHPCVRPLAGGDFITTYGDTEFQVLATNTLTGSIGGVPYHLGASLAKPAINQALFALYNTGTLCLEISSDSIATLTDGGFQLTAGTLDLLTEGKLKQYADPTAPAIVAVSPSGPPIISYGAGTVDEGHILVEWKNVEISFYVMMFERFSRVFAVSTDIKLQLAVFNDPGTETLRVAVVNGPTVDNFQENYNELLPGVNFTEVLSSLIGVVFDAALGDSLEFNYDIGNALAGLLPGANISVDFQGLETLPTTEREFLNIYLSMSNSQPQTASSASSLRLAKDPGVLRRPEAEDLGDDTLLATLPTGEVKLDVDDPLGREYFARVDFGAWRGPLLANDDHQLVVQDGKLSFAGRHSLAVRSRLVGDNHSLQPAEEAEVFTVWVDIHAPRVELVRDGDVIIAVGRDDESDAAELVYAFAEGDADNSAFTTSDRVALDSLDGTRLTVVARDPAGNSSKKVSFDVRSARAFRDVERERAPVLRGFHCDAGQASGGDLAVVGLVGLLLVSRRRRGRP